MRRGSHDRVAHGDVPSQRQLQVAETIRHALAAWLLRGELHDPALADLSVTVSEVRTSRDLKHATAFVAVLGRHDVELAVLEALNRAAPWLAGRLGRSLHLKYAPKLRFEADDRYEEAARIDNLIRAAHEDDPHGS